MSDEGSRAELAELVEDHLGREPRAEVGISALVVGLAAIAQACSELQQKTGRWALILEQLRGGVRDARAGIALLSSRGGIDSRLLLAHSERRLAFASLLETEIVRLQANESTLV